MPRVSIPQAVSTVATINPDENNVYEVARFNTASGKHCCNVNTPNYVPGITKVSIPQAVSTVATLADSVVVRQDSDSFNTASGKHCCNLLK